MNEELLRIFEEELGMTMLSISDKASVEIAMKRSHEAGKQSKRRHKRKRGQSMTVAEAWVIVKEVGPDRVQEVLLRRYREVNVNVSGYRDCIEVYETRYRSRNLEQKELIKLAKKLEKELQ